MSAPEDARQRATMNGSTPDCALHFPGGLLVGTLQVSRGLRECEILEEDSFATCRVGGTTTFFVIFDKDGTLITLMVALQCLCIPLLTVSRGISRLLGN